MIGGFRLFEISWNEYFGIEFFTLESMDMDDEDNSVFCLQFKEDFFYLEILGIVVLEWDKDE